MYNPQNAKEQPGLPQDTIFEGAVISVTDGKVKNFVKDTTKWRAGEDSPAISVAMEIVHNNKPYKFSQVFSYEEENGQTVYSQRSNLGKFKAKYGSLPQAGTKIKASTNNEGFLRLKLD